MNQIFKVVKNHQGNNVVASELAKGTKKGGKLAAVVMAALFTGTTFAVPVSIQGTATSENAVSIGTDSFATAVDGVAGGKGSVATGQGFNRDEFAAKVNEQNALLNDQATKQGELETIKTNLEANDKTQENLGKQIDELTNVINRKEQKSNQLDTLNTELDQKNDELSSLQDTLNQAKSDAGVDSSTQDKTIWTDFTAQLGKLNWNNLSDDSNGTTGLNKVASELKSMVEADYPDLSNWEVAKYEEVISGYINRQGLFDANQDGIGTEIAKNNNYLGMNHVTANALVNLLTYDANSNKGRFWNGIGNSFTHTTLVNYLDNQEVTSIPVDKIDINSILNMTYESVKAYSNSNNPKLNSDNGENTLGYAVYNLKSIINSDTDNTIQGIAKSYVADSYSSGNNSIITTLLELPPVLDGEQARLLFTTDNDLQGFISRMFTNELASANSTGKAFVSNSDINRIRNWLNSFYDGFYNKVDLNADESKWLFDKNSYISQLEKVEGFASTLRNYVAAYDDAVADPQNADAQIRLVTLYNQIREQKDNSENYFENINVELKQSTIDLWNEFAEKSSKELTDYALKLKLYEARNEVIQGVTDAAKKLQENIDNAQKAVDDKQREIDEISKQIDDLALTPDEKGAADLKAEKEKELADKKAEKDQLEADKAKKENELNEINRQLANSSLKDLGLRSQAHGSNAFASGNDSIAIGTNSTVTANDGIVMGRDSTVTGVQSIAIGTDNNVQSERAVALGNNITIGTGFDGAVVLGDSSTAASANPTASMEIRGQTYNFAGTNPTSTVSVGGVGSERQIVNVAAGRVDATSTDAINGSQLYAVADVLNKLETSAVNPDDVSEAINHAISNNLKAGDNITIDETTNPDNDSKTFTINAKQPNIEAGKGVTVEKNGDTFTINAEGKTYTAGDNVMIGADNRISANGTTVSSGEGITVTTKTTTGANGATNTDYRVALSDSLKAQIAKEENVTSGSSNVVVKQDGANETGGKNFVVDIAKNLDLTDKGSIKIGDVIIAGDNVTVGGNQIHNVADGVAPMDAVNVRQLESAKTEVKGGTNAKVTEEKGDKGQSIYTVNVQGDLTSINSISGDKGTKITLGDTIDVSGSRISNVVNPINPTDAANKDYVDNARPTVTSKDATVKIVETVANTTTGAINYDLSVKIAGSIGTMTDDGKTIKHQLGDTITVTGDRKNISTATIKDGKVQVKLADDVKVNSVTTGNVSISTKGINAGSKKVVNVTPAEISPTSADAVNGSQLHTTNVKVNQNTQNIAKLSDRVNHLDDKIDKVNKRLKAGIAGANAAAALPQVRGHGKSMVSAASGYYEGQNAIAVGYSRASDNGKLLLRVHANANTRGQIGGGVGIGYEW